MSLIDVERVHHVFQLFSVEGVPNDGRVSESYMPEFFIATAARELGLFPTSKVIHAFLCEVQSVKGGEVYFAAFLQFCENVAYTNCMDRSAIYGLVDDLDVHRSGMISRRELFLLLTSGSATISEGEVEAVMELLDPSDSGYIELKDLAALLIRACAAQTETLSVSVSKEASHSNRHNYISTDGVEQPTGAAVAARAYRDHCKSATKHNRSDGKNREGAACISANTVKPMSAATPPSSHSSEAGAGSTGATVEIAERDRSFKRTDVGSDGLNGCRGYSHSELKQKTNQEHSETSIFVEMDESALNIRPSGNKWTPSKGPQDEDCAESPEPPCPPPPNICAPPAAPPPSSIGRAIKSDENTVDGLKESGSSIATPRSDVQSRARNKTISEVATATPAPSVRKERASKCCVMC